MSSTHVSLYVHVVFGTKARTPSIEAAWRDRLHAFIGGVARECGVVADRIGGVDDHVHMLVSLPATIRLMDAVRDIKRASSKLVHDTHGLRSFGWQVGYGAFSVSTANLESVRAYIANQAEHHRTRTFHEEYISLLERAGVEYDERFLD